MDEPINQTIATSAVLDKINLQKKKSSKSNENSQSIMTLKMSTIENFQPPLYSKINSQPKIKIFFFEFLGMFIFIYGICCIVKWVDLYIVLSVLMGIVISVTVSGANLNPMITLSNVLKKQSKYKVNLIPIYYSAQFLGTILGLILCSVINDTHIHPFIPDQKTVGGCIQVVASEMLGTFILIFFILQISNPNTTFIDSQLSGYMFIVLFIHIGRRYAPVSHSLINPIIILTTALISAIYQHNLQGLKYFGLWLAGDLLGTFIALVFYQKVFDPNIKYMRSIKRSQQNQIVQSFMENHMSQYRSSGEIDLNK